MLTEDSSDTRVRILTAARELLVRDGVDAVTTRAVAAAASVQAPTLYRLFGDKRGLLDAVALHALEHYVSSKAETVDAGDAVQGLRDGWNAHIEFCLTHPGVFALMSQTDGPPSRAAVAGLDVLRERVRRIARAGRLRVKEARAVALIRAAGTGVVMTLLEMDDAERDMTLAKMALDAVLSAILTDATPTRSRKPAAHAVALRAQLTETTSLTPGERLLLGELLDKITAE